MATFRINKQDGNFVMLDKTSIYDERLSFKAKGVLLYLLSRPDHWKIYTAEIIKHSSDGKSSVNSAIQELIKHGYIVRQQLRKDGKFSEYEYEVYEIPTENRFSGIGKTENGKTEIGKSNTSNNNSSNNDSSKNNSSNSATDVASDLLEKEFEEWYEVYNKKKDKKAALTKFKAARKKHSYEQIMNGTKAYLKTVTDKQYQKYPKTFLHNESYLDDYSLDQPTNQTDVFNFKNYLGGGN